jgi:hypothetical protein
LSAACEDGGGIDVEELGVEGEAPEHVFGGGGGGDGAAGRVGEVGRIRGAVEERYAVGLDFARGRVCLEV